MNEWWVGLISLTGLTVLASILFVYPLRRQVMTSLLLAPLIFIAAFAGYYYWGSFDAWQHHVQDLEAQKQAQNILQSIKSPQELIEKLRVKLDNTPKSAKGWYLLGRLYSSQNENKNAVDAFAQAYRFYPDEEQYAINYVHSLWVMNNQQFSEQITELLDRVLKNNPQQPDALALLAMDAFMSHAYEDAVSYWQRLLKTVSPQSEEAQAIRKAIAQAEAKIQLRNKSLD